MSIILMAESGGVSSEAQKYPISKILYRQRLFQVALGLVQQHNGLSDLRRSLFQVIGVSEYNHRGVVQIYGSLTLFISRVRVDSGYFIGMHQRPLINLRRVCQ